MAHGPSFDAALGELLERGGEVERQLVTGTSEAGLELESWRAAAAELEAYFLATSEERFADAGRTRERLRRLLSSRSREGLRPLPRFPPTKAVLGGAPYARPTTRALAPGLQDGVRA